MAKRMSWLDYVDDEEIFERWKDPAKNELFWTLMDDYILDLLDHDKDPFEDEYFSKCFAAWVKAGYFPSHDYRYI